ncbi:MAG: hypothetical protein GW749_02185 [Alphaproteobacteria bacterium]|nr:hypothetical protein [Alphaproteobacteria bacterium]
MLIDFTTRKRRLTMPTINILVKTIDLIELDSIIESYDYKTDPLLTAHFHQIETKLWHRIESYCCNTSSYGAALSAHLRRVSQDGHEFLTDALGFSKKAANNFHAANLFHDLGKTHNAYNEDIWNLPYRPTDDQRAEKRLHTVRGTEIFLEAIADLPLEVQHHPHLRIVIPALQMFHHERLDGQGYAKRHGDEMGRLIKALCIVDCKDGDLVLRGHHVDRRTEKEALLRMKGLSDYDGNAKYVGAFDEMLDHYIHHRELKTGQNILS